MPEKNHDFPASASRYLHALAATVFVFAFVSLSVGFLFDPYGVSPVGKDIPGLNTPKIERINLDRLIKPIDVINRKPKTLLVGTSRVKQGFDPEDFRNTGFWPVYNLGIDFSSPTESLTLLELLLPLVPEVEIVVLEVNFIHFYRPGPVRLPRTSWQLTQQLPQAFFSWSMIDAALKTSIKNSSFEDSFFWIEEDGQAKVEKSLILGDSENFFNHVVAPDSRQALPLQVETQRQLFDAIDATCAAHNVKCIYAFFPYQPLDLAHLHLAGHWDAIETVKRFFAERGGAYDFTLYNFFTNEPLTPNMGYWFDVNHFTPELGGHIASVLNGTPLPDTPDNFGPVLRPDSIDAILAEWTRGRDGWIADNPQYVARIEASLGPRTGPAN